MMGTVHTHAVNYSLYSKLPYHPVRDFTSIALARESPNALNMHPRVAANTIQELIAPTLARPSVLNFGSSGACTSVHLSGGLIAP
jgi:tripartite-type tricarboxylate transporter receptor subunit TctC